MATQQHARDKADSNEIATGSKTTTNHDEIRKWAEERGGTPAVVEATGGGSNNSGILRIDFPGYGGEDSLKAISWEEFFRIFDQKGLRFLYGEKTKEGKQSRFNKFVSA